MRTSALLVVDMRNAFCPPPGLGRPDRPPAGEHRRDRRRQRPRGAGRAGGYVDVGRSLGPLTAAVTGAGAFAAGSWDAAVVDALAPAAGDHTVDKPRFDAFLWTSPERLIAGLRVDHLWGTGVLTSVCVESTVRGGAMRDLDLSLAVDGCTDISGRRHEQGVEVMARWGFATPVGVDDITTAGA